MAVKLVYCRNIVIFVIKKIIADSLKIENLKKYFLQVDTFSTADLFKFYSIDNRNLTKNTLNWRLHKLVKMGVLQRVGRGLYSLGKKKIFYPEITNTIKKLYEKINEDFPFADFCIWHTSSLNKFMRHQAARFQFMLDIERDVAESVFYFIKELYPNVFLNPNEEIYTKYISGKKDCIIINNLVSEAPTQEIYDVKTTTIEKILVDIYCDKIIYSAFQGHEMKNIFYNAFNDYTININTLLRYAQRRGKKSEIEQYIIKNTNFKKVIKND